MPVVPGPDGSHVLLLAAVKELVEMPVGGQSGVVTAHGSCIQLCSLRLGVPHDSPYRVGGAYADSAALKTVLKKVGLVFSPGLAHQHELAGIPLRRFDVLLVES